jgi:hypothetical protein
MLANFAIALLSFFTTWNIILVIFHKFTHQWIDLMLSSLIVLFVSTYICYIDPGYLQIVTKFKNEQSQLVEVPNDADTDTTRIDSTMSVVFGKATVCALHVLHLTFHVLPVFLIAYLYGTYYIRRGIGLHTLATLLIFFIYASLIKVYGVYMCSLPELVILGITSALAYCFFLVYLNAVL